MPSNLKVNNRTVLNQSKQNLGGMQGTIRQWLDFVDSCSTKM